MATKALIVAAVAAGLLVLSVGVDLAYNSTLQVRAGVRGETLQLVGEGQLDGRPSYARPLTSPTLRANASDVLVVEATLQNAYPWAVTRTFTLTRDGCYDGAETLGSLRVRAPASGDGKATAEISVDTLLRSYGAYFPKEPAQGTNTTPLQPIYLQVCRGERAEAVTASFTIEEVSR